MSERKSTPGPWVAIRPEARDCQVIFSSRGEFSSTVGRYIAAVGGSDDTPEMVAANAVLLAAAPELADALRERLDEWVPRTDRQIARYKLAEELLKRVGY